MIPHVTHVYTQFEHQLYTWVTVALYTGRGDSARLDAWLTRFNGYQYWAGRSPGYVAPIMDRIVNLYNFCCETFMHP